MFKFIFLIMCVCFVRAEPGLDITPALINIKSIISDKTAAIIGATGKLVTGLPLYLSQGIRGTGDWLSGIIDRTDTKSAEYIARYKLRLDMYKTGLANKLEDATLRCPELVTKYGYPMEEYEVTTDDGYLLTLFRIPYSPISPQEEGVIKPPILLMHGFLNSADIWLLMGPHKSLAYMLADAGYDVWLGNARGNTYSKKHISKSSTDSSFWDFSWDEIGKFDLPAMIDFILAKTGQKDLYYVGFSQGTTCFFVMCSTKPEYNEKIRIMFALGPIAWVSNAVSPMVKLLSPANKAFEWISSNLGIGEFLPSNELLTAAGGMMCQDRAITQSICKNSLFVVCGFNTDQMNATMLPVFMGHTPAGASVKQFLHYSQGCVSKDFRCFDHGPIKNKKVYGASVPPSYDLSKVTAPVSLFYSANDWLSHPIDVNILSKKLGHMIDMYQVPDKQFCHLDYVFAIDADKLVYNKILDMMPKY